jgi:alkylated DNA repair dioxygenase AlkB
MKEVFGRTLKHISKAKGLNVLPKDGEALFFPDFFNPEESDRLFKSLSENIAWQQDQIKFFGKIYEVPRLTALYGDNDLTYTYSGIQMKPHAWTPDLLEIKGRIEEEANVSFTSVLLNLYRDGKDSNGWHSDDEKELGVNPVIGSVSFGASRIFKFRHLKDKTAEKVELTHGSFVLMRGETQHKWEHQIPKTAKVLSPRINLTFRIIQ